VRGGKVFAPVFDRSRLPIEPLLSYVPRAADVNEGNLMRMAILALLLLTGTALAADGNLIAGSRDRLDLTARDRDPTPAECRVINQWLMGRTERAVADRFGPPDKADHPLGGRTVWIIKFRSDVLGIEFERGRVIDFMLIGP